MRRLSSQAGFTLVEVMVAALVLAVVVIGVFTLLDAANRTTASNAARTGATNLAREMIEYARASDYHKLTPTDAAAVLQARPTVGGTGNPFRVTRRNVSYTVEVRACIFDDPKDGLTSPAPAEVCTPAATPVAGAPASDHNPDDFRRLTINLSWRQDSATYRLSQTALIVNPSGGLGPRILNPFPEPGNQIGSAQSSVEFNPVFTTSEAAAVHWTVDDGATQGDAARISQTSWRFSWDLGDQLRDGIYLVSAQAFDSRGTPGDARVARVGINRSQPLAPTGVQSGRNYRFGGANGVVELRWDPNPERDIVGYRVYRNGALVCPASGTGVITGTSCWDDAPGNSDGNAGWAVVAVDREDILDGTSPLRDGESFAVPAVPSVPGTSRPPAPGQPTATLVDGLPKLDWPVLPAPTPPIRYYRIYRDTGTGLADRYDITVDASPTYTDPKPGSNTSHRYWITAVDANWNESDPSPAVTSLPTS